MNLEDVLKKISELPSFELLRPLTPRSRTILGDTPLHVAAIWGDNEAISILVKAGAFINAVGEHGYTPLHEAAEQGHDSTVKLLISLGADVSMKNDDGETYEACFRK